MARKPSTEQTVTLAIDLMGSDVGPTVELEGAYLAWKRRRDLRFILIGDKVKIMPILEKMPKLLAISKVVHTDISISHDDIPSAALRTGKESSMALAIKAVKDGKAQGAVSAGNTGALMALSCYYLKTLDGIDRPAIAGIFPSKQGDNVMLDLGANLECKSKNLCEFAVMGSAFARCVLGKQNPRVGLINIGTEEMKGTAVIRETAEKLRHNEYAINYYGFVEGSDIAHGTVDVVVSDGFIGNIALKTTEGTVKMYTHFLKEAIKHSIISQIGYLFVKPAFKWVMKKLDPRMYNTAFFLGLNGLVAKSHGHTDAIGFANSIVYTRLAAENKMNETINDIVQSSKQGEDTEHRHVGNVISMDEGLS